MRKKDLLLQNTQLYDRLSAAEIEISNIKKELLLKDKKIAEQAEEIERLKSDDCDSNPIKKLEQRVKSQANVSPEIEYGSEIIGKTVVEAAKSCNQITLADSSEVSKELVNLILGRTEVAKSEILKIISSTDDNETKKQKIDSQYDLAVDYFKSIIAQRN